MTTMTVKPLTTAIGAEVQGIDRTTSSLVLDTPVPARVLPAIEALDKT